MNEYPGVYEWWDATLVGAAAVIIFSIVFFLISRDWKKYPERGSRQYDERTAFLFAFYGFLLQSPTIFNILWAVYLYMYMSTDLHMLWLTLLLQAVGCCFCLAAVMILYRRNPGKKIMLPATIVLYLLTVMNLLLGVLYCVCEFTANEYLKRLYELMVGVSNIAYYLPDETLLAVEYFNGIGLCAIFLFSYAAGVIVVFACLRWLKVKTMTAEIHKIEVMKKKYSCFRCFAWVYLCLNIFAIPCLFHSDFYWWLRQFEIDFDTCEGILLLILWLSLPLSMLWLRGCLCLDKEKKRA